MKTKGNSYHLILLQIAVICFTLLIILPYNAASEEIYKFERMWPTLLQPWYFR